MTEHTKVAGFVGYEEIKVYDSGDYHRYELFIDSEDIEFDMHDSLYVPPAMKLQDMVILLIYDFELTAYDGRRPSKVIYTDFYFRALENGIRKY